MEITHLMVEVIKLVKVSNSETMGSEKIGGV